MTSKPSSNAKSKKPLKNSEAQKSSQIRLVGHPALAEIARDTLSLLKPPPELTISQWADSKRQLSSEANAEPGGWNTDKAPYQRGIMDTITDEHTETIVLMASAQVGKTEIILNTLGYFMDQDPCPVLLLQPTLTMAEAFSKDRVSPMIRDTSCLTDKCSNKDNTILHKKFSGGHLTMAGANSPSSLASRPIRIVLCDETDRFPVSAGEEGDPIALAEKRTTTFTSNRKLFLCSTPTVKGASRIESAWEASDQRRYHLPCPSCGALQYLKWSQIRFNSQDPSEYEAYYECEHCEYAIHEGDKQAMLMAGVWIAGKPFTGTAGFHLNELYSPWVRWSKIVENFLKAKVLPETLKVWVNTSLGESYTEKGSGFSPEELLERCEEYGPEIPHEAMVLTCGVDVQNDRLELETVAWGDQFESWSMDYRVFYGNPAKSEIWKELDDYLKTPWQHESGLSLPIKATCIDSGGSFTDEVYKFVKPRKARRIFAIKGLSTAGNPLVGKPTTTNKANIHLYGLGVDTGKEITHSRLGIEEHGPGYCHFRKGVHDEPYFESLTSEKVHIKYIRGFASRVWKKPDRARNEALDCRNYAQAALGILKPEWKQLSRNFGAKVLQHKADKPASKPEEKPEVPREMEALIDPDPTTRKKKPKKTAKSSRNSFVNRGWR